MKINNPKFLTYCMSTLFRSLFSLEANSAPSYCLLVEFLMSYTLEKIQTYRIWFWKTYAYVGFLEVYYHGCWKVSKAGTSSFKNLVHKLLWEIFLFSYLAPCRPVICGLVFLKYWLSVNNSNGTCVVCAEQFDIRNCCMC